MHEASGYRVEYVAPVAPFAATFEIPETVTIVGVTRLDDGGLLPYERDGSRLAVTIDNLGTHETIVVHLAGGTGA
jgi:hypothetical protein